MYWKKFKPIYLKYPLRSNFQSRPMHVLRKAFGGFLIFLIFFFYIRTRRNRHTLIIVRTLAPNLNKIHELIYHETQDNSGLLFHLKSTRFSTIIDRFHRISTYWPIFLLSLSPNYKPDDYHRLFCEY